MHHGQHFDRLLNFPLPEDYRVRKTRDATLANTRLDLAKHLWLLPNLRHSLVQFGPEVFTKPRLNRLKPRCTGDRFGRGRGLNDQFSHLRASRKA